MKAMRDAVNEVILPLGWHQSDVVDAVEILRRKGHSPPEIARPAEELGRAMKTGWESIRPEEVTTNSTSACIDAVYRAFQRRHLFQRECPMSENIRSSTGQRVAEALQNGGGTRERSRRRPGRGGNGGNAYQMTV